MLSTGTTTSTQVSTHLSPHRSRTKLSTLPEHIRIKNRRKRYLEKHPSYFGPSLESADPLLYDRLIRTHQTDSERTAERTAKGFAGTLEADLLRSEAKLDEVKERQQRRSLDPAVDDDHHDDVHGQLSHNKPGVMVNGNGTGNNDPSAPVSTLTPLPVPPNEYTSLTRDEAYQQWIEIMSTRFVRGEDEDFDYDNVDGDDGLDDLLGEERDREEEWFDGEEEGFVGESESEEGNGEGGNGEGKGRELKGETGVQDF